MGDVDGERVPVREVAGLFRGGFLCALPFLGFYTNYVRSGADVLRAKWFVATAVVGIGGRTEGFSHPGVLPVRRETPGVPE